MREPVGCLEKRRTRAGFGPRELDAIGSAQIPDSLSAGHHSVARSGYLSLARPGILRSRDICALTPRAQRCDADRMTTHTIAGGNNLTLHVEESGNPAGKP